MNAMEHTEADRLLGAATPHSAPISVDDMRSMNADETEVRSGRWGRKAGLAFAAFAGLGALGVVATNAVRGGSAGTVPSDPAQLAEQSGSAKRSEEESSLRDQETLEITGRVLSMMKRTHLSINAIKGGTWLSDMIGLGSSMQEYWFNSTSAGNLTKRSVGIGNLSSEAMEYARSDRGIGADATGKDGICASRSLFYWKDIDNSNEYDWHEFQGSATPTGPLGPDYWWDLIYTMNTQYDSPTDTNVWNVFLHSGSHMYVDDLTKHVVHLEKKGTPYLARSYTSQAHGDNGRTMYVIFVPNPYNGNVVIIHSGKVGNWRARNFFRELEPEACVQAVSLPYPLDDLDEWWDDLYVETVSPKELPRPIPIMDSHPVHDYDEVVDYFGPDALNMANWSVVNLVDWSNNATTPGAESGSIGTCSIYTIQMQSQFKSDYQMRYVYTPQAKGFDELGRFVKYVDSNVREVAGFNTGYSRWMDNHIAISLPTYDGQEVEYINYLDQLRPHLEQAKTPYHTHITDGIVIDGRDTGSIWAWGPGGLGIEWHGTLNYTSFEYPVGNFDFCTVDSACQPQDVGCNMNGDDDSAGATRK